MLKKRENIEIERRRRRRRRTVVCLLLRFGVYCFYKKEVIKKYIMALIGKFATICHHFENSPIFLFFTCSQHLRLR
jgi:hypothetical protein